LLRSTSIWRPQSNSKNVSSHRCPGTTDQCRRPLLYLRADRTERLGGRQPRYVFDGGRLNGGRAKSPQSELDLSCSKYSVNNCFTQSYLKQATNERLFRFAVRAEWRSYVRQMRRTRQKDRALPRGVVFTRRSNYNRPD
jgi:hypothetical protein